MSELLDQKSLDLALYRLIKNNNYTLQDITEIRPKLENNQFIVRPSKEPCCLTIEYKKDNTINFIRIYLDKKKFFFHS